MANLIDLMGRYCDGDASAFRELYAEIAPRLQVYLEGVACDDVLAAELVQQTFLKVHHARAAYVRGADPVPWIYSFAHQTYIERRRPQDPDGSKDALSSSQREAVVLRFEGKSITEAAAIVGVTIATMKVRTTVGLRRSGALGTRARFAAIVGPTIMDPR